MKHIVSLALIVGTLLAGFAWLVLRPHEPVHLGKPLSYWLDVAYRSGQYTAEGTNTEAEKAIRQLGSNAVPILVDMAATRRGIWRGGLNSILNELARDPDKKFLHAPSMAGMHEMAVWGLKLLGAQARGAIPKLIRMLEDPDPWTRVEAAECLASIGPSAQEAVPALVKAFNQNADASKWEAMMTATACALAEIGSAARPAISSLKAATNNCAAQLAIIRISGESALPYFEPLKNLSDPRAWNNRASLVYTLGDQGEPAIPFFVTALTATNSQIQMSSISSIGQLHRRPEICVPALIPFLQSTNLSIRQTTIIALQAFGPGAKPAVPQLTECLKDPYDHIRRSATHALRAIDAEAAARILKEDRKTTR